MATHIYPQWFHRVQKVFFIVAVALLFTLPVLYGREKIDLTSTEVIVIFVLFFLLWAIFSAGVRLCVPSVVIESTLPTYTHAPEPTVFLHGPTNIRTAVPTASALKSFSNPLTTNPLRTIDTLEHHQLKEQEEEDQDFEQIKKKLAQDISFSSSTTTSIKPSLPTTTMKTARFAGEEQVHDDDYDMNQRRQRQGSDVNIVLDHLSSTTPPTPPTSSSQTALRRGYVSTPTSPLSSPTTTRHAPPLPLPSSSSPSPRGVSFQSSKALKRSSTDARHGRSNSSSATGGVRFQRGLGSPSIGVSEEEDDDDNQESSSYPTFASYRQAQHAKFDGFAQRIRRTLETAAAAAAAASADARTTEESLSSPPEQSIPGPTTVTPRTIHTDDITTPQPSQPQPPSNN